MSISYNAVTVTTFLKEYKHQFQPMVEDIRSLCRVQDSEGSKVVEFPVIGRAVTVPRLNYSSPLPLANVGHSKVTCTPVAYTLSEFTDIFALAQCPYSEIEALAQTFALSAKRRMLQVLLDGLAAGGITKNVPKTTPSAADNLNMAMIRLATKLLNQDGVPPGDRTVLAHTNGIHYLTGDPQVASSDFNTVNVLNKGEVGSYYGWKFMEVPNLPELSASGGAGGLPLVAGDRTNYAFHKLAVGIAVTMDPKIRTDWDPTYGAHRTSLFMNAGACVIDPLGVCTITTSDALNR
jgi:hypothetical protein